ncbi:tryptophan halogenase family protein [Aliikangiella coralliicola]|nr:tryptophan halogenase family protein [Aliikangiella coralliicola]
MKKVNKVLIVGGGTAGWITAAKLAKNLQADSSDGVEVTLVESPDIPTIGVGEGTWPTMRKTLLELGINEGEFMAYCQATFKQGTKFVNWKKEPGDKAAHTYYHMFSSIFDPSDFNLAPYWLAGIAGENTTFATAVSAQGNTCDLGCAPKKITDRPFDGVLSYAYHLDAGKFAEFLTQFATEKLGVKLIKANATQVHLTENGDIKGISVDRNEQGERESSENMVLEADLFVDCTGFRSLLLGESLNVSFKSVADTLLTDTAIAIQVPYESEDAPIPCQTNSIAQESGWIWDISLFNRRGTGHVFSSNHMHPDEAESVLRKHIGPVAKELESRTIKMNIGYREKFWEKNCVAVGLSAAFVEPLEASAIFLIEAAGNMLVDMFPKTRDAMDYAAQRYNQSFLYRWEKTIEFIKLHYYLSQRESKFWQDNKADETVPEVLRERVAHWRTHPVSKYEFDNVFEPFPHESYQYVIYGMGIHENGRFSRQHLSDQNKAMEYFKRVRQATELINKDLPQHRELLKKAYQYGFQTL